MRATWRFAQSICENYSSVISTVAATYSNIITTRRDATSVYLSLYPSSLHASSVRVGAVRGAPDTPAVALPVRAVLASMPPASTSPSPWPRRQPNVYRAPTPSATRCASPPARPPHPTASSRQTPRAQNPSPFPRAENTPNRHLHSQLDTPNTSPRAPRTPAPSGAPRRCTAPTSPRNPNTSPSPPHPSRIICAMRARCRSQNSQSEASPWHPPRASRTARTARERR
mmetsp:Transcript_7159/g.23974  ORF Transcript_7159/g.23974 Transcript_7159/m.23974 type:complete len:227 (+) Transcript_7159:1274-1954(+)